MSEKAASHVLCPCVELGTKEYATRHTQIAWHAGVAHRGPTRRVVPMSTNLMDLPHDVLRLIVARWIMGHHVVEWPPVCRELHRVVNSVIDSLHTDDTPAYLDALRVSYESKRLTRRMRLRHVVVRNAWDCPPPFGRRGEGGVLCGATTRSGSACRRGVSRESRLCRCAQHDAIEWRRYHLFTRPSTTAFRTPLRAS